MKKILLLFIIFAAFGCADVQAKEIVVIDNGDSGYEELVEMGNGTGGIGGMHRIANNAKVTYTPQLDTEGMYSISMYIPVPAEARVNVDVYSGGNIDNIKIINGAVEEAGWYDIGKYYYASGEEFYVMLSSDPGTASRCDAVRFSYVGETEKAEINDIETSKHKKAINVITALGIMETDENNNFNPNEYVTRGYAAKTAYRLKGNSEEKNTEALTKFFDVNPQNEYSYYIDEVSKCNLMNGYEDGSFRPNENLKFNEIIKILVCLIKPDIVTNNLSYPSGYITAAAEKKIYFTPNGEFLTRGELAQLIYNMLDVEVLESGSKNGITVYEEHTPFMEKNLKIKKAEGVVNGDSRTGLTSTKTAGRGSISIGDEIYLYSGSKDVLGYYADAYISTENDENEVVYVDTSEKNNTAEVFAEDIEKCTETAVEYKDGNKRKKLKLDKTFDMIYNGEAKVGYSYDELNIKNGKLFLIDNNGDGVYDVVFVWDLIYKYVDYIQSSSETIVFNDGEKVENSDDVYIYIDGKRGFLTSVESGNTVGYAKNSTSVILFISSSQPVKGKIQSSGDDEVTVNSQTFKVGRNMDKAALKAGNDVSFYIDSDGFVRFAIPNISAKYENYACVMRAAANENEIYIKFLESSGKISVYDKMDSIKDWKRQCRVG